MAWTGSSAAVRLIYPKSYYYEPKMEGELLATPVTWQRYIVPRGIYGIVVNEGQGIDKYQLILHNLTTVEAWLIHEEQDWNSTDYTLLSKNELIKKSLFNRQNSYMLELKAWDLNGDTQSDTAVFDPFSNTGIYTRAGTSNPVVDYTVVETGAFEVDGNTLALWRFDEGEGVTASDETGNYNGTVLGNWTTGKFDGALQCETDLANFIQEGTLLDVVPAAITIEMWFKTDNPLQYSNYLFSKINKGTSYYDWFQTQFLQTDYSIDLSGAESGHTPAKATNSTTTAWDIDTWYYVAFVWDTTRGLEIWVNGAMESNNTDATTLMANGTDNDFYIGCIPAGAGYSFIGIIDEVRVSNIARTQAEIEAHWAANQ